MSDSFDPYFKWLAIPPEEQPPNHYRLLGVPPFTDDLDVIETAADKQMVYLHGCSTGEHANLAEELLKEFAVARLCLLNPQKKAAYDTELRTYTPPAPLLVAQPLDQVQPPDPVAPQVSPVVPATGTKHGTKHKIQKTQKNSRIGLAKIVAGSVAGLVLGYLILCWIVPDEKPETNTPLPTADGPPQNFPHGRPLYPDASNSKPLAAGATVDLLKLIDLERDSRSGNNRIENGVLVLTKPTVGKNTGVAVPYIPPEEYDLTWNVRRTGRPNGCTLGLVAAGHRVPLTIGGAYGHSGLSKLDGKPYHRNETSHKSRHLIDGKQHKVVCRVRRDSVVVEFDDKKIIDWTGDFERFPSLGDKSASRILDISGGPDATFYTYKLELTPISGTGRS